MLIRSPMGENVVTEVPGLPAGGAPFVSLWAVDPVTRVLIHLPHALKVDMSPIRNSGGTFRFEYPAFGKNFQFLHNRMVNNRVSVEVELWVGGSRFGALGGDVLQVEGDDVDEESVWKFAGKFYTNRLSWATVRHDPAATKGERRFANATAGTIMRTFMQEAQTRGTLADLTFATFSNTVDSAGVPWSNPVTVKFTPYADGGLLTVLSRLVALGLCEGEVDRDKRLMLFNAGGDGRDLTTRTPPTILRRAKDLMESSRRIDVGESGTDVYATGAEGLYSSAFDATARARWAQQIEMVVDSNQIDNQSALDAFVQTSRSQAILAPMELTHGLVFGTNRAAPISGFRVNDWIFSDIGRGLERVRVAQWVLSQDASGIKGSVTLNDIITDQLTRVQRRIAALADGSAVVGTSTLSPVEDTIAPAAPVGLVVNSLAYDAGTEKLSSVTAGWSAVTTNSDGTAAGDIAGYRVEWRNFGNVNSWILGSFSTGNSTSFGGVGAGINIAVRVACFDHNGNTSAFSGEVPLTTQTDNTPPPVPSTPIVTAYLAQLRIRWNGLGSAGQAMPADLDFVEVHVSIASNFTPSTSTLVDTFSTVPGERIVTDLPYGVLHFVRFVAVDSVAPTANRSAPSVQASAFSEQLVGADVLDGAVGTAKLANLAVVEAKIGLLAVNDGQFGSGSFGKLTAGTINVSVTNAGIIRTATSGQRTEQDSAGIRLFNSAGVKTIDLSTATGMASITGSFQSNLSGDRIVINPAGEPYPTIFFHDNLAVATNKAYINGVPVAGRVGLGMNSGENEFGFQTTLFLLPGQAALSYNTFRGTPSQRRGGYLDLRREFVEMGVEFSTVDIKARIIARDTGKIELLTLPGQECTTPNVMRATGGFTSGGAAEMFELSGQKIFMDATGGALKFRYVNGGGIVKTFVIDHPDDPDRYLVHGCTESPHAGIEYWGAVDIDPVTGEATVELPGYFESAARLEGRAVFLSPLGGRAPARTPTADYPTQGRFGVHAPGCQRVSWHVKAVRADVAVLDPEPLRSSVTVRGIGPYRYIAA